MYAIQCRCFVFLYQFGCCDVGQNHTFFDDLVRFVAVNWHYLLNLAVAVENKPRFYRFKLYRATTGADFGHLFIQRIQIVDIGEILCILLTQFRVTLQNRMHFVVCQAGFGMHHRFVKPVTAEFALRTDMHISNKTQAVHMRIQ